MQQVSTADPVGYIEAQKQAAVYTANLGQIKTRQQAEASAAAALQQAQAEITDLIESVPPTEAANQSTNRSATAARLQQIINQLETIKDGTTAYPEAQRLLHLARERAKQL